MQLDKKQLPQLIVLGVLVMACIGYVSFTIVGSRKQAPPAAAKATAKADVKSSDTGGKTQAAIEEVKTESMGVFPDLASVPMRRDPFLKQAIPGERNEQIVSSHVSVQRAAMPISVSRTNRLASGKVPPINPFKNMFNVMASSSQPEASKPVSIKVEEQDPQFVLTGVICGQKNVAIIRVGDGGRYVVKEGQLVDGRYRVKSVTDNGAVLVCKNRRIELKLGGVKNAS